jgi:hypothetical protein
MGWRSYQVVKGWWGGQGRQREEQALVEKTVTNMAF